MADIESLVERCRQKDELAWEALVRELQGRIYALAFHYVRDPDEARDLAQEVFIRVYNRLDSFRGGRFLPWILQLARNCCIDRLRRRKARPPAQDVAVEDGMELTDSAPSPEDSWLTDTRKRLVYRALGRMSDQNREMILLKEIQGLNFQEISEMLKIPIGTAKSRSNRARIELARKVVALDPSYGELAG